MLTTSYSIASTKKQKIDAKFYIYDDDLNAPKIVYAAAECGKSILQRYVKTDFQNDRDIVYHTESSLALDRHTLIKPEEDNSEILKTYIHIVCKLVTAMWNLYTPLDLIQEFLEYLPKRATDHHLPGLVPMHLTMYYRKPGFQALGLGEKDIIGSIYEVNPGLEISDENYVQLLDWSHFRRAYNFWLKFGGKEYRIYTNFSTAFLQVLLDHYQIGTADGKRACMFLDLNSLVDSYFVETFLMNPNAEPYCMQAFWEMIDTYCRDPQSEYVYAHQKMMLDMLDHIDDYIERTNCHVTQTNVVDDRLLL